MKIFANNFAIQFELYPSHGHFRFEVDSLQNITEKLRRQTLDFPGQTFYCDAGAEKNLKAGLFALHTDEEIAEKYATLAVYFRTEDARDTFFNLYSASFVPLRAAGGLVRNDTESLLMIFRHGRWDLPKGKVEEGEPTDLAARREVEEETGISTNDSARLFARTYHVFPEGGRWRLKTTFWYLLSAEGSGRPAPQEEEGITEVKWVPLEDLRAEIPLTWPQIMELVRELSVN